MYSGFHLTADFNTDSIGAQTLLNKVANLLAVTFDTSVTRATLETGCLGFDISRFWGRASSDFNLDVIVDAVNHTLTVNAWGNADVVKNDQIMSCLAPVADNLNLGTLEGHALEDDREEDDLDTELLRLTLPEWPVSLCPASRALTEAEQP